MPNFKIGDKVRIKSLKKIEKAFNATSGEFSLENFKDMYINQNYKRYCGVQATITSITPYNTSNKYNYTLDLMTANGLAYNEREFEAFKSPISFKKLY